MSDDLKDLERSILPRLDPEEAGYLRQELDDLRLMVARGDPMAIGGGLIMMWWGCVLVLSNIFRVFQELGWLSHDLPVPLAELVIGYAGNIALLIHRRRQGFASSWRTQTLSSLWFVGSAAIFVFFADTVLAGVYDPRVNIAFVALLYAVIISLTGVIAAQPWLYIPAAGWTAVALVAFRIDNLLARPLLFAASALVLMFIPGLIMTLQERRATQ